MFSLNQPTNNRKWVRWCEFGGLRRWKRGGEGGGGGGVGIDDINTHTDCITLMYHRDLYNACRHYQGANINT